jgi:hypothetical protein
LLLLLVPPDVIDIDMSEAARGARNGWRSLGQVTTVVREMLADVYDKMSGKVVLVSDPGTAELTGSVQFNLDDDPASLVRHCRNGMGCLILCHG